MKKDSKRVGRDKGIEIINYDGFDRTDEYRVSTKYNDDPYQEDDYEGVMSWLTEY